MLKTLGKWLFGALILFVIGFTVIYFVLTRSMPDGVEGAKAEAWTNKMLRALNHEGYKKLKTISWTFRDQNHYKWNKQERNVLVSLPDVEVLLDFETDAHQVLRTAVPDSVAIRQAISNFYNDSFWLVAPFKIRDKGTTRKYVETKDGPGILVTYASGGVTPGDSYLWVLDENYRPKYWRLWTSNVPIPGLKFEWTNWQDHQGVWFAPNHPGPGPLSVDITNLKVE